MKYLTIYAGCAECLNDPLMEIGPVYEDLEAAKVAEAYYPHWKWKAHEQGGFHQSGSSGGVWLVPMDLVEKGVTE